MKQNFDLSYESESEERIIGLQKVKTKEPQVLDVEFFINEAKNAKVIKMNPQKAKTKLRQEKPTAKDQPKAITEVPLQNLKKYSLDMIGSFKQILNDKFNSTILTELEQERKSNLERLFPYLCFGLQQCFEARQFDTKKDEVDNQNVSEASIQHLKLIAFQIDRQLLKAHNEKKKTAASLKFKIQWNFLFEIIKDLGNFKLRAGIVQKKIKVKHLVYANEADLKEFLSEQRQKNLEFQADKILRISQNDDLKLHFEEVDEENRKDGDKMVEKEVREDERQIKEENKDEENCFLDSEDETTVMTEIHEAIETFKEPQGKGVKRTKPKTKKVEEMKSKRGRKARKLNEI